MVLLPRKNDSFSKQILTNQINNSMIGDLILWISKVWKQQTCIHRYIPDRIGIITGLNHKRICSKCNKLEN